LYALSAEPIVFAPGVVERIGVVIKVEDRARSRASLFEQIESHLLFECNFRSYDDNGIGGSCLRAELIRKQFCYKMGFALFVSQEAILYCPGRRRLYGFAQRSKIDLVGFALPVNDLLFPQVESHQSDVADAGLVRDAAQYREQKRLRASKHSPAA